MHSSTVGQTNRLPRNFGRCVQHMPKLADTRQSRWEKLTHTHVRYIANHETLKLVGLNGIYQLATRRASLRSRHLVLDEKLPVTE